MTEKKTKKKKNIRSNTLGAAIGGIAQLLPDNIFEDSPCSHSNLVPIEIAFIRITHPNGYKEQPKCEFYVGISLATAFRVRKYFCPKCKEIIKAPSIYAEEK